MGKKRERFWEVVVILAVFTMATILDLLLMVKDTIPWSAVTDVTLQITLVYAEAGVIL